MKRPRERLDGKVEVEQMDFLYWFAHKKEISRSEATRIALDNNPEYKKMQEEVDNDTELGRQYLKEAAIARRLLSRK